MEKDVVIFDIETNVLNKKPDGEVDKLKYCGFKLPSGVYLVYSEKQISAIQQIFNRFNVFSGHNILGYDLPVLRRYGIRFKDCTFIDTYQIASKRMETMMGYKGLGLGMKSLRFLAELFNLPSKKGEFDYELLKKPFLNSEEYELMKEYLIGDLDTSEALLEYFMDFFSGFKEFMSYKDVSTYKWLTSSSGTTAYKCICNQAGIPEIYDDNPTKSKFQAAISWVNPKLKYAENVVCLDFACIPFGEDIYTCDGYKKIEKIMYGDISISNNFNYNMFVKKKHKTTNKLIKLTLQDGTILKQTPEHKLLVGENDVECVNINIGDVLKRPIDTPIPSGVYDDLYELLGIWICEGSQFRKTYFRKDKRHPNGRNTTTSQTFLGVKKHEIDFKKRIEFLLDRYCPYPVEFKIRKKQSVGIEYEYYDIYSSKKEVYDWFNDLKKSLYNLPSITENEGKCKAFLSGVLKSDACWNKTRNSLELSTTDFERANIINKCFQCLGIHYTANIINQSKYKRNSRIQYEIYYGSELKKLFSWFKFDSYRDDVITEFRDNKYELEYSYAKVVKKEIICGNFIVFDLAMNESEFPYFIHNGYLTHNSLYPHMMIGGNLYSTTVDNDGAWHGGSDVYKSIEVDKKNGIRGYYKKEQGKIEKVLFDSYLERKNIKKYMKSLDRNSEEYRNLDRKQYAIKIYLNTCFDKQTEILTRDGIKFVKDVKVGENVLSINKETHELEWKKVTNVYKFKYEGDMVGYRNKNTDILVTPDHDMVFEGKNGITQTLKAKQLSKRARYNQLHIKPVENRKSETKDISEYLGKPKNIFVKLNNPYSQRKNKNIKYIHSLVMHKVLDGNMNYDGEYFYQYNKRGIKYKRFVDVNAFMYLVGIYIAEGCCRIIQPKEYKTAKRGKSYISNISQYKDINPNTYNKIENILKQLGFRYYKTNKSFCISDKGLYDFFITCGKGSGNKKIPFNLDDLSYENLYSLHEGLYDGDGNKAQYRYTTKSKKLRDQMVELNLLLGFRCNYTYDGCWRIARTTQGTFKRENFYTKHYNDYVYCVTVEDNHTVYVGRNGKFSFTGQCYGIAGNPRFKQVFNLNRANDITAMARASITHARDKFKSYGYEVLYIHTDSCYVIDKFKNIEKIKEIAKEITEEQKKSFNIPIDTHEFEFEEFYKKMWLVQGDDGKNIKNRNIRLTEDNKIKFTGIKMQSLAVSDLAKKVFWDYIVPQLVGDKKDLFFKPEELKKQLKEVAKKQPELLEVRRKVYDCSTYKSDTSMQYQISKRYGEGVHKLIANGYIGAGKSKKYCKMSELKKTFKNKWLDAVDYSAYLRDLSEFINPTLRKKLK